MIAVVALIVLGPKGLPAAARAIGRAVSELRRATSDLRQSIELDPQLKDIPNALDELNRPLLSPSPYPRKRMPKDGPPPELKEPPSPGGVPRPIEPDADETLGTTEPSSEPESTPHQEPKIEKTTTKPHRTQQDEEPVQHVDEPDGRDG